MTTPSETRTDISNLLDILRESDIALHINPVVLLRQAMGNNRVTWAGYNDDVGELFRGDFSTIENFRSWLMHGAYSAVLFDGAIIQLTYDFNGDRLKKYRLAYYPCPFDIDQELLLEYPILDIVDSYIQSGTDSVRLRSPIRFDFDLDAAGEDHPASHMTLLWPHCRWPVSASLSPGHFVRFVFKNFYPRLWVMHEFLRDWPQHLGNLLITQEQQRLLHIACQR